MFMQFIYNFFLPFAITTVKEYVKSTSSKDDDLLLDITKQSADYLSKKSNNTVLKTTAKELNKSTIIKVQKSKV